MITKDGGCSRGFLWKLTQPVPSEIVITRLQAHGFQHSNHKVFSVLTEEAGHKVIVVHSNSRVQIRIDLTTAYLERQLKAAQIAQKILSDNHLS